MSQSYREGCNDHKAVVRGIVEPRPVSKRRSARGKDRWRVFIRYPDMGLPMLRDWFKVGAYSSEEVARKVAADHLRKHPRSETRVQPATDPRPRSEDDGQGVGLGPQDQAGERGGQDSDGGRSQGGG